MSGLPITVCWSEIPRLPARALDTKSIVIMDTIKQLVLLRGVDIAMSQNDRIQCLLRCNEDFCGDKGSGRIAHWNVCKGHGCNRIGSAGRIWKCAFDPIAIVGIGLIDAINIGRCDAIDNDGCRIDILI